MNMGLRINAFWHCLGAKTSSLHASSLFWKGSQRAGMRDQSCWMRNERKSHTDVIKLATAMGYSCSISPVPIENPDELHLRTVTLGGVGRKHLCTDSPWVIVAPWTSTPAHLGHWVSPCWRTWQGTMVALWEADQSLLWTGHQSSSKTWGYKDPPWRIEL